ncbi:unnamed protein product [Rangifer tarandus platyrhynchus]|uniref:Uncharacterized protein n=1 Tax=Rangifer tarandus platyrhynchus TaxID=3082113 RepID=A0ABN8ZUB9_RANTA|nr:unnamed protein product [Rangifer tarandus platyrhynchus]
MLSNGRYGAGAPPWALGTLLLGQQKEWALSAGLGQGRLMEQVRAGAGQSPGYRVPPGARPRPRTKPDVTQPGSDLIGVCNENIIYSGPPPGRGTLPFSELAQSCEAIQASQPPAGQLRFPDNALLRLCPTITPSSEVALTGPGLGDWILRLQDHHHPSHK